MKQFLIYVISLATLLSLNGCNATQKAQRKLAKANDLINEAKRLDPTIKLTKIDSLKVSIVVPESRIDSVFESKPGDTTIIENKKIKITHIRLPDGEDKIEGVVKQDTVITTVAVESDILIKKENYKEIVKRVLNLNNLEFWLFHLILSLFLFAFIFNKLR